MSKIILEVENANKALGISEAGLISFLMGNSVRCAPRPEPATHLAQKAVDFWVEEWSKRGVQITSALLRTEFDPEDGYWYFVIELRSESTKDIETFVNHEMDIITAMAENESTYEWMVQFTVFTKKDSLSPKNLTTA